MRVSLRDERVEPLLTALTHEYETRYGQNSEMARTRDHEFDPPSGLFVILVDGDTTVAGGGFRRHDETTCEVKRMWTRPGYRRRGLASRVLASLEEAALEAGYSRLVLETGPQQPEAEAMYERRGYRRTEPFGPYAEAIAFSVALGAN